MAGKLPHQLSKADYTDPFNAGQMVGMLVILSFIEKNNGIPQDILHDLMTIAADNVQQYFNIPSEDIFLMVDKLVKEMK